MTTQLPRFDPEWTKAQGGLSVCFRPRFRIRRIRKTLEATELQEPRRGSGSGVRGDEELHDDLVRVDAVLAVGAVTFVRVTSFKRGASVDLFDTICV